MDLNRLLRYLAAILILISGILHLVAGIFLSGTDMTALVVGVAFGVLYIVIGVGLFAGKQIFSYLGVIFPLIGGIGGTYNYVTNTPVDVGLAVAVGLVIAIDVIVVLCCCYLLLHRKLQPASE